jgi:thiol-disulfide isomerase/thioredoxin
MSTPFATNVGQFLRGTAAVLALLLAFAAPARADRTQVYSIQKADCGDCGAEVQAQLKKAKGIRKSSFDRYKVELTVTLADGVRDDVVLAAAERAHLVAVVGPGHGAYLPHATYPAGADVRVLTNRGDDVGPLEALRVTGKYTVFDVYADWCGPCRIVDGQLRDVIAKRTDIAVRKLNVVSFDTPLAKRLGARLKALPYVIVFAPDGKRTELVGVDLKKLNAALGAS